MAVQSVSNATATQGSPSYQVGGDLGKNEFMSLLVTQLKNQDPLDPMDNHEFISQLAQFSSLEQLQNISDKLGDSTSQLSAAATLIGHEVEALGKRVNVEKGISSEIQFDLSSGAGAVFASISDSNGVHVRTVQIGPLSAGRHTLKWDGMDDNGKGVADGKYVVDIQAVDLNGNVVSTTSLIKGKVTSASVEGGATSLVIGNIEVPLSNVVKVNPVI